MRDLLTLSRFRRLLAVRLTGQVGDGFFQAALATYALFGDEVASAADLAAAAAVVLLPWSLLGPAAGVALDRWSRRQVLLVGNLLRAGVLILLAGAVAASAPEPVVYIGALVALGINRFLLAGLSAGLPHTVPAESLTEANAITPTLGTAAFVTGLGVAGVLRGGAAGVSLGDPGVLVVATMAYLGAGASALRLARAELGPRRAEGQGAEARPLREVAQGIAHLRRRPLPAAALLSLTSMRLWFGLVSVSGVLSLRNAASKESTALADLAGLTVATGGGFLLAALAAPLIASRLGRARTLATGLVIAAASPVPALVGGSGAAPAWWWTTGAVLGLGAQVTKICVDAILQAGVDDAARGRVFSLYDTAFNVAFVVAAAIAVPALPPSGYSASVLVGSSLGLAATAAGFARTARRHGVTPTRSGPSTATHYAP